MDISTFSAIQTIKYSLEAKGVDAVECFKRKCVISDPVDQYLVKCVRNSHAKYKAELQKVKQAEQKKKEDLSLKLDSLVSKAASKAFTERSVSRAFKKHMGKMKTSYNRKKDLPPSKKRRI